MVASKALMLALIVLVASQFTINISTTGTILTSMTLVFTAAIGLLLLKSVTKEIEQREELQVLTKKLERANGRLKELDKLKSEFVSIASHQLRSPLTAIRGYASLLVDGSYGKLPAKATEALERISESSKNMAYSIEDYLNVSRIESGNMKYNKTDFNLKDETEKVSDDLRPQAIKRGLTVLFRSDLKSQGVINADVGKVIQILQIY
jgi:two-component system, NtrC family, sensor kinase